MIKHRIGLVVWLSVLSGLQGFTSAGAFADIVGPRAAALALAVTASLTMGTATFMAGLRGEVTAVPSPSAPLR